MHVLVQDTKMADAAPAAKPADEAMDGDVRSNGPSEVTNALACSSFACFPLYSIPHMSTVLESPLAFVNHFLGSTLHSP